MKNVIFRKFSLISILSSAFVLFMFKFYSGVPSVYAQAQSGLPPEVLDQITEWPGNLAPLPSVKFPANNPQTPAKVELGKLLYFDNRLSKDRSMSCASCHHPSKGYADGLPRAKGFMGKELGRHSPTILNAAFNEPQFWDGRASGLEEQAKGPMLAAGEMNMGHSDVVIGLLEKIPGYQQRFKAVFGEITFDNVAKSIAAFERTLITKESRYDNYLRGNKMALNASEKRGMGIYIGKASCTLCHNGANLTDNKFHNIGVPQMGPEKVDLGRFVISQKSADIGAFKTPTLRNIEITAPYMHDGAFKTLEEVVDFYNKGGDKNKHKSSMMEPLGLSTQEKKDLVNFLKTLTGTLPEVTIPEPLSD